MRKERFVDRNPMHCQLQESILDNRSAPVMQNVVSSRHRYNIPQPRTSGGPMLYSHRTQSVKSNIKSFSREVIATLGKKPKLDQQNALPIAENVRFRHRLRLRFKRNQEMFQNMSQSSSAIALSATKSNRERSRVFRYTQATFIEGNESFSCNHYEKAEMLFPSLCLPLTKQIDPDVRTVCSIDTGNKRTATLYMRQQLRRHHVAIRATKWAPYLFSLVLIARRQHLLSWTHACSIRYVLLAYVQSEQHRRNTARDRQRKDLQKQTLDFQLATQSIQATPVIKYGRKGKPHTTQLIVSEDGAKLQYTCKTQHLLDGSRKYKEISLLTIRNVLIHAETSVFERAIAKKTFLKVETNCTLSIVTYERTLDLKTNSMQQRDWLIKSLEFLMERCRNRVQKATDRAEWNIIQKMSNTIVYKHGRKGLPRKTTLFVNRFGELSWTKKSRNVILMTDILSVEAGAKTAVFIRARARLHTFGTVKRRNESFGDANASFALKCFSLITKDRTLDIETRSADICEWFVVAFRYLTEKAQERNNAMRWERAEREIVMLKELSIAHDRLTLKMAIAPNNFVKSKDQTNIGKKITTTESSTVIKRSERMEQPIALSGTAA